MCISPLTLKRNYKTRQGDVTQVVPCGKCMECLGRRRNAWSFRLYHQMMHSDSAYFMTLTYGYDEKRGYGVDPPLSFNGLETLRKKDVQDFMKRLRKYCKTHYGQDNPLKYYLCGEYGSKHLRPHYHAILFNLPRGLALRSQTVGSEIWKNGSVDIAICNIATINYVVGYVIKGAWEPQEDFDDRIPEFSMMSKKLGSQYLTEQIYEMHLDRMETSVIHPAGFRMPLPRYYREKIFSREERKELEEIRILMNRMNWQEFANYDFGNQVQYKNEKIRKHQKKILLERQTF